MPLYRPIDLSIGLYIGLPDMNVCILPYGPTVHEGVLPALYRPTIHEGVLPAP